MSPKPSLLRPQPWLYCLVSLFVLTGLLVYHYRFQKSSTVNQELISSNSVGFPLYPFLPYCFFDFFNQKKYDYVFSDGITLRLYSETKSNVYSVKFQISFENKTIKKITMINFTDSNYYDLCIIFSDTILIIKNTGKTFDPLINYSFSKTSDPFIIGKWIIFQQNYELIFQSLNFNQSFHCQYKYQVLFSIPDYSNHSIIGFSFTDNLFHFINDDCSHILEFNNIPQYSSEPIFFRHNSDLNFDFIFPVFPQNDESYLFFFSPLTGVSKKFSIQFMYNDPKYFLIGDINLNGKQALAVPINIDEYMEMQIFTLDDDFKLKYLRSVAGFGGFVERIPGHLGMLTSSKILNFFYKERSFLEVSFMNSSMNSTCEVFFTDKEGKSYKNFYFFQNFGRFSLPFLHIGFSSNVHYIQEINNSDFSLKWVLPNSKIYLENPNKFQIHLYWNFSWFPVLIGIVSALLLIGFFILIYTRKEDDEDKEEAVETLPLF